MDVLNLWISSIKNQKKIHIEPKLKKKVTFSLYFPSLHPISANIDIK